MATKKIDRNSFDKESHRKNEGWQAQVTPEEVPTGHKKKIFPNEKNQLLEGASERWELLFLSLL